MMKRLFAWLAAFSVLFFTANTVAAQCGNYFKANYRAVNKLAFSGEYPRPYLLDDWTGDGRLDYWNFQVNSANSTNDIIIYPAKTTGYWDWDNPIVYTTAVPGRPHSWNTSENTFYVKDFNSDGRMDLHFNDRTYQNNGSGGLTTLAPASLPFSFDRAGFFDFNGDGLLDVLDTATIGQESALVYRPGNADGSFGAAVTILTGNGFTTRKLVADYNNDGRLDIAYSAPYPNESLGYRVLLNAGNGTFTAGNWVTSAGGAIFLMEQKDFNADGRADIFALATSRKVVILTSQGDGTFTETVQQLATPQGMRWEIAELNGDNSTDLVEYHNTFYTTYVNNGANVFTPTVYQKKLPRATYTYLNPGLLFKDFTGDGKADFVESYYTNNNAFYEPVVMVYENVCQAPGGETKRLNFDGDAQSDLAMWNPTTGEWSSKNNSQSGAYETLRKFTWGSGSLGDVPAPGDFDGDGKTDYSVFRNSTGTWYVFLSSNSSWLVQQFGLPGDIAVPNDYDGGGKTDIAVWRPADGNWYIWYSETQSFGGIHFGAEGDKPVPSDYDGDGKTDVAVYRPSEGGWYYLKSSDGAYSVYQWGIATDKPLPADYDGDGKSDLTVFRDGVWYIWRSSDNQFAYLFFGLGTDVPIVSHSSWTSEFLANPAVFRSAAGAFYSRLSTLNPFWGSASVPVQLGLPNN